MLPTNYFRQPVSHDFAEAAEAMFRSRHPEVAPAQSNKAAGNTNKGRMHTGGRERQLIRAMHEDATTLGVLPPDYEPKATEHIGQMIAMIQKLQENGKAYAAENGDVYYSVRSFPPYGQLSGKNPDDLRAGERIEIDSHKRDPLDLVLQTATSAPKP